MNEELNRYDVSHLAAEEVLSLVSFLNNPTRDKGLTSLKHRLPTTQVDVTIRFVDDSDDGSPSPLLGVDDVVDELTGLEESVDDVADVLTGLEEPVDDVVDELTDVEELDDVADVLTGLEEPVDRARIVSQLLAAKAAQTQEQSFTDTPTTIAPHPRLTDEEFEAVRGVSDDLRTWIAESDENAAKFLLNPVDVIETVASDINPYIITKLRQLRTETERMEVDAPVEIGSLSVETPEVGDE